MAFKFVKNLLTQSNAKTIKGEKYGWETSILYLAPANLSGTNVCKFSTAECREACLNTAGRGAFTSIQTSRLNKTRWMLEEPESFYAQLAKEVDRLSSFSRTPNIAVRLNGTSDIWNGHMESIIADNPFVQFYDYTKDIKRMRDFMFGKMPHNYHLTYSFGGGKQSLDFCDVVVQSGFNVAVVFDGGKQESLTKHWRSYDVLDGDIHDLRFLDDVRLYAPEKVERARKWMTEPEGFVIGLRAKGKARKADVEYSKTFVQPNIDDE